MTFEEIVGLPEKTTQSEQAELVRKENNPIVEEKLPQEELVKDKDLTYEEAIKK
jgi:hypothetical protein